MRPAEYRIQNTEYRTSGGCGRQNTEYRIQNPGGPHPSTMQFPHLLGDSVCCGRIQNARRTVQHAVSTPFGGFCMLRQNPECAPDRPTCSFHTFCGILYAAAEYRMQGVECKDTGKRRLQQNPRFLRIQNPGLQFLFPHPQPLLTIQRETFFRHESFDHASTRGTAERCQTLLNIGLNVQQSRNTARAEQ